MNDDQRADRVTIESDASVLYWTYRFNVSLEELEEAIDAVGDSAAAVAAYLKVDPAANHG
ncbi:MAG: DUF3606 domain-containing protein [Sphingobium sp.]|uniref:DUF3606 domain-containing protein n=1 Tax=Sphingobium sp. TaxID=1912891 RepID=UPI002E230AFD